MTRFFSYAFSITFSLLPLLSTPQTVPQPQPQIRGWNILSDSFEDALVTLNAAPEYRINHLQLSHDLVMDLQEIRDSAKREKVNKLIAIAHSKGIPEVVLWDHALYNLKYYPDQFKTGPGKTLNLDNPAFWEWFRQDYREMLQLVPEADGLVLTFIETGARAEKQYSEKMLTGAEKLAAVVDAVASVVCDELGKKLYIRTFAYTDAEYANTIGCISHIKSRKIILMMKETPHDFFLTHPNDKYAGTIDRPTLMEFDTGNEFNGQGIIANTWPEYVLRRWSDLSARPNVIGYVARTDRYRDSRIVGTPNEILLYALKRYSEDKSVSDERTSPPAPLHNGEGGARKQSRWLRQESIPHYDSLLEVEIFVDRIYDEFITLKYGEKALPFLKPAFRLAYDIITSSIYTLGTNMANHSKMDYDPYKSSYGRHVSGKWLDPPVVQVGHGVNREFHYWKEVIEHLAPARFKEPDGALMTEAPQVILNQWVTPEEKMDPTFLKYVVAEKQYGVESAMKALSLVGEAKPFLRDSDYKQNYQLFYRTLLTARVYAATAKAYFGYRVYARGEEYHSEWLRNTIQEGLDSMLKVAEEIERYPGKVPVGQWKWRNDAATAREYHQLITETGWKEYGGVVFALSGQSENPFQIKVVDDQTQRGVPLVELKTTNDICYVTDNNGIVAFREPGLMNQEVFFHLLSHGYEVPEDGFGYRGIRVKTIPGDSVVIRIKRINIAERLYRITGQGLYHHSLEAGLPVPLKQPALNGQVTGQDTFMETLYNGKIFWVWGDTNKPSYPLGNFSTSGATSELPGLGGLDPSVGIDLDYFTDETGFSKEMCPVEGPGPVWMHWLTTLKDTSGKENLVASWTRVKTLGENYEQGMAVFDDGEKVFKPILRFELNSPFFPDGHSFKGKVAGQEYIYFDNSTRYPVRVKADMEHLSDLPAYEAFTCLKEGAHFDTARVVIDCNPDGSVRWGWKKNGEPLDYTKEKLLLKKGILKPGEGLFHLTDVESGSLIQSHSGSVFWNPFREKWVMILEQIYGTSFLGEVWYAEGDTPVGPWVYCRKIVTHNNYSFYNVGQHSLFDQEGGKLIYFEGTYTNAFTNNPVPTPRYNYNQIMYRLNLSDSALFLPEPVYLIKGKRQADRYALRKEVTSQGLWNQVEAIPFFAFSPGRSPEGSVPAFLDTRKGKSRLTLVKSGKQSSGVTPLFYAFPGKEESTPLVQDNKSQVSPMSPESPLLIPLYEFKDPRGNYLYSTEEKLEGYTRSENPLCRVYKNPATGLQLDPGVKPVPAF